MRSKFRQANDKNARLQQQVLETETAKESLLAENQLLRSKVSSMDAVEKEQKSSKFEVQKLQEALREKERIIQQLLRPGDNDVGVSGENRRLLREIEDWRARVAKLESNNEALKAKLNEQTVKLETERTAFLHKVKSDEEARRVLATENLELKEELEASGARNPEFWEELEDLKENYKEALRLNIQYEHQLESLTTR
ncbi:hypothetical protein M427DRAFT_328718 [Gonapodya prolifera JEL478]|uniref:Uncharacterized protein n=1 Tax=Gonapodya prolifera (strain JEL478) TaxID=1344416 RepID=A0A139AES0_GONPJ|nr:hypothetical protein M427DRAFT_328718 [Gonapodya prolifera JEL478]|eukprot:KXS15084.1 hypothetical protein M427DRAFT_328718 [Gonapodya prolifera JEL478]